MLQPAQVPCFSGLRVASRDARRCAIVLQDVVQRIANGYRYQPLFRQPVPEIEG